MAAIEGITYKSRGWRDYTADNYGFGKDGLRYNNIGRSGTADGMDIYWKFYLENGRGPNSSEYIKAGGGSYAAWKNIDRDFQKVIIPAVESQLNVGGDVQLDPKELAFNEYYRDLYSLEDGTGGREMLTNLEDAYTRQYESQGVLADAQYQSQAMQQAAVVKQITDQIRSERMSRLKAGMNPAQIANQDMQMMMANVGALNQSALAASQQSLEAQLGINNAKDEAYMAYLDQANARGQNAAAMYAADSGNANKMTLDMMRAKYGDDPTKWNIIDLDKQIKQTTGQGN